MKMVLSFWLLLNFIALSTGQTSADPQILAEVNKIKAVDNHTHVQKVVAANERDEEFDALPCDPLEASDVPSMARPENPKFLQAWEKLYAYKYNDRDPSHVRELLEAKRQVAQQQGDKFPTWVLDQLNIDYMLANRVDKTVFVRSDARARYERVVDVVDNLRAAGVDNIGLLTEQIQDKNTPGNLSQ